MGSHVKKHTKDQLAQANLKEPKGSNRNQQLRWCMNNYQETQNKLIVAGFVIEGLKYQLKQQENTMKKLRIRQQHLEHLELRVKSEQNVLGNKCAAAFTQTQLLCKDQEQKVWKLKSSIQKYKNLENITRDENRRISEEAQKKDEKIKDLKCTLSNLNNWNVR